MPRIHDFGRYLNPGGLHAVTQSGHPGSTSHLRLTFVQLIALLFPATSAAKTQCWKAPFGFAGTFHRSQNVLALAA